MLIWQIVEEQDQADQRCVKNEILRDLAQWTNEVNLVITYEYLLPKIFSMELQANPRKRTNKGNHRVIVLRGLMKKKSVHEGRFEGKNVLRKIGRE